MHHTNCILRQGHRYGLFVLLVTILAADGRAQSSLDFGDEAVVKAAVRSVSDSVVQIETIGNPADTASPAPLGPRTGFFIQADGYILTSSSNIGTDPTAIFVTTASGQRLVAEIIARNESRHVTLLKIDTQSNGELPISLERSELRVGQTVIAIGKVYSPAQPNISLGILSATHRIWGKAIQTDAKISALHFGGPLIDLQGRIVGILVPMSPSESSATLPDWDDSGVGFAIPLSGLRLHDMIAGQNVVAGKLGISFKEEQGMASLAIVAALSGNSPALIAGIQAGDRIVKFNQQSIQRLVQLKNWLGPLYAGDEIALTVDREGTLVDVSIQLVDRIQPYVHAMLGILPANNELQSESGIEIAVALPGPAKEAGMLAGDRIIAIDDHPITNLQSLLEQLVHFQVGDSVAIDFERAGEEIQISLELDRLSAESLPPMEEHNSGPPSSSDATWDIVELSVPEHPNRCFAYRPLLPPGQAMKLLVWIEPAGPPLTRQGETEDEWNHLIRSHFESWKPWCDRHGVMVMLPQSHDAQSWRSSEIEYLAKVTQQAITSNTINSRAIAIGGNESGGTMASLVAFTSRSVFQGLILMNATFSKRIGTVQSDAIHRLSLLLIDNEKSPTLSVRLENLRSTTSLQGFPVFLQTGTQSPNEPYHLIMNWIRGLPRL